MPRPSYILCSVSGSEDARTGALSHFQVIEKIEFRRIPPPGSGESLIVGSEPYRVTAVWVKLPGESPEQEFEYQTVFFLPGKDAEEVVQQGRFAFGPSKTHYRTVVISDMVPPLQASGSWRIESRVRAAGDDGWVTQGYVIPVEEVQGQDDSVNTGPPL